MNRRKFLSCLGTGTAVVALASSAVPDCEDPWCGSIAGEGIIPHDELHGADAKAFGDVLCDYAEYSSFSAFALTAGIYEAVSNEAAELSHAHGRSVNKLYKTVVIGRPAELGPRSFKFGI